MLLVLPRVLLHARLHPLPSMLAWCLVPGQHFCWQSLVTCCCMTPA